MTARAMPRWVTKYDLPRRLPDIDVLWPMDGATNVFYAAVRDHLRLDHWAMAFDRDRVEEVRDAFEQAYSWLVRRWLPQQAHNYPEHPCQAGRWVGQRMNQHLGRALHAERQLNALRPASAGDERLHADAATRRQEQERERQKDALVRAYVQQITDAVTRDVLWLLYRDGMTQEAVAAALGVSTSTVRRRKNAAHAELDEGLRPWPPIEADKRRKRTNGPRNRAH